MYQKYLYNTLILLILLAVVLSGCALEGDSAEGRKPITGLANPASVYCQGLGFKDEARENDLGQHSVCIFPDNSECDTWDFLAGRCGQEFSYCAIQGFELKPEDESNIGTCVFDDGSTCSEFSYFERDCKPGENIP